MCTLVPQNVLMCYDGTLEGFFSLVFHAYARHCKPESISAWGCVQPQLMQAVEYVETDLEHAERVKTGLARCAGYPAFDKVKMAFLSRRPGCESALFDYIEMAMSQGHRVHTDVASPAVSVVEDLVRTVLNECEKMRQFARFEEMDNGVFFARVNPQADIVYLVMDHFAERFNSQPFVIYDEVHGVAGVYDCTSIYYVVAGDLAVPQRSAGEEEYQRLWKAFYDSVSNEQRYNPDLRRSFMPKRYWKNITEMRRAC